MKKHFRQTLSLLMSLIMIISMFTGLEISSVAEDETNQTQLLGDLDGDGYITSFESRWIHRASVGLEKIDRDLADMDADGKITDADARLALRYSACLETAENVAPARMNLDEERYDDITINCETYKKSAEEIKVVISAENAEDTMTGNIFFSYNTDVLEFIDLQKTADSTVDLSEGYEYEKGKISYGFVFQRASKENTINFIEITFRVLKNEESQLDYVIGTWYGSNAPNDGSFIIVPASASVPDGDNTEPDTPPSEKEEIITPVLPDDYPSGDAQFYLNIPNNINAGDTFNIVLSIANVESLMAGSLELVYNNDYLEFISIKQIYTAGFSSFVGEQRNDGVICCGFLYATNCNQPHIDATTITFKALQAGSSELTLSKAEWDGDEIPDDITTSVSITESTVIPEEPTTEEPTTEPPTEQPDNTESYLYYEIIDGEVTITACDYISGEVVIPETIEGYPVTAIGGMAFAECAEITSVSIPDSVKTIGDYAFYYCASLESIIIPDGVTTIGEGVFNTCLKLTAIEIPDSVTSIGHGAFSTCALTSVEIPDNVTTIGNYAFSKCGSLESVTIGKNVTTIGTCAFESCDALSSVTIPENVTSIDEKAFGYNMDWEVVSDFTINGVKGTAAETYATENGITFISLGEDEPTTEEPTTEEPTTEEPTTKEPTTDNTSGPKLVFKVPETIKAGDTFTVVVGVENAENLWCGDLEIKYNKEYIECMSVNQCFVSEPCAFAGGNYEDETIVWSFMFETAPEKISFDIVEVTFKALKAGTSDIEAYICSWDGEATPSDLSANIAINKAIAEEPTTEKPTEKPVSDKLTVKGDTVKVDESKKISTVKTKSTVDDVAKSITNGKYAIVDKDGKALKKDALVGTGSKIEIMNNSGKVVSTYTVVVPNDVDGNGKTTAADARLALRGSAKLDKIDGVYATASDANGDGKITAADARKILRISAGLEK